MSVNNKSGEPDPKSLILTFSSDEEEEDNYSLVPDSDSDSDSDRSSSGPYNEEEEDDMMYYERAIQEIAKGDSYTCMICTVEMDYTCKMFPCSKCYRVFDYDCIREWAIKSTEKTVDKIWKCPNCYHVNKKVPPKNRATCWCGKVINPEPNPLDPNSCGQTCDAAICQHGCSKTCHLGPHPECTRMITIKCKCGKHTKDIPCFQSRQEKGKHRYQCKDKCNLLLSCGIHRCQRICHSGLCGTCPETLTSTENATSMIECYCGSHSKDFIKCRDVQVATTMCRGTDNKKWTGVYACSDIRTVEYSCHKHSFLEKCMAPPTLPGKNPCPFSPKLLKTCPCGRTSLQELATPRKKCTDPIPHCDARCGKPLKCGKHTCPHTCHEGTCMDPCIQIDKVKCACHQSSFLVPCAFEDSPHCNIKCESLMSCRRHRCTERCCSGRPLAEKRKKTIFRSRDVNDEMLVEAQHICLKDCNLMLSCGKHKCQRKCHPGKCPPCLESDSNDLVCPCGKTVVPAPVRCGTVLTPCNHPCIKVVQGRYPCGHTPMPHTCHPLDQPCPPCTATVFKPCKCGKKDKVRTVCFQNDVSCGQVCGQQLKGCYHKCQKTCHLPDDCQTECKQVCNLPRENCLHACKKPCHGKGPCPDIPCTSLIEIKCPCGRKTTNVICGATSTIPSRAFTEQLSCDDECEAYKRNQQLREAFGIANKEYGTDNNLEAEKLRELLPNASSVEDLHFPFSENAIATYGRQTRWCGQIEDILNKLLDDMNRTSLHFKPMRPPQRYFVRELAKAYNLYAESQDREPKRSVFVKKNDDGSSSKPPVSLADVLPIYQSFKIMEKERKMKEFLARTTTQLINIRVPEEEHPSFIAKTNGFFVKGLSNGTTNDDLIRLFDKYMKPTLITKPQYKVLEKDQESAHNDAIVYPENYSDISENAVKDLEALVGHFDYMVKEEFVAESVELCNISEILRRKVGEQETQAPTPGEEEAEELQRLPTPGIQEEENY